MYYCEGLHAHTVQCSWTLTIQYLRGQPVSLFLYLLDDNLPPLLGLDFKRHVSTDFITISPTLALRRPSDSAPLFLPIHRYTYLFNVRTHLGFIIPLSFTFLSAYRNVLSPLSFVCRLHLFSHAAPVDLIGLLKLAGYSDPLLSPAVRKLFASCMPCAHSGPPPSSIKSSLARFDSALNICLRANFIFCVIRGTLFSYWTP